MQYYTSWLIIVNSNGFGGAEMLIFLIGVLFGSIVGVLTMAFCLAVIQADECAEKEVKRI